MIQHHGTMFDIDFAASIFWIWAYLIVLHVEGLLGVCLPGLAVGWSTEPSTTVYKTKTFEKNVTCMFCFVIGVALVFACTIDRRSPTKFYLVVSVASCMYFYPR